MVHLLDRCPLTPLNFIHQVINNVIVADLLVLKIDSLSANVRIDGTRKMSRPDGMFAHPRVEANREGSNPDGLLPYLPIWQLKVIRSGINLGYLVPHP